MKIRATQLLKNEDFPSEKDWIEKLIGPINDFFKESITILNGGITFADQAVGKDYVFAFTYQSDASTFPQKFLWTLLQKPVALNVVSATEDGIEIPVVVSWKLNVENQVQLTQVVRITSAPAIAALQANKKYQIRVRVTP